MWVIGKKAIWQWFNTLFYFFEYSCYSKWCDNSNHWYSTPPPPLGTHHLSLNFIYVVSVYSVEAGIPILTRWWYVRKDVIPVLVLHKLTPVLLKAPATQRSIRLGNQPWIPNGTEFFGSITSVSLLYCRVDINIGHLPPLLPQILFPHLTPINNCLPVWLRSQSVSQLQ